ncbi:hypothetical protein IE53DRAFT_390257 [Violaceomyces palustris]|uniref:Uncharacterized protein n=1 Tax=Violaceomyces palustris TaxID=1673888 RepID=A0ACD0NP78_9BASI|nr:hypothetical protein IE53DRAFT_390257 [Violaceomyces palustris]
MSPTTNNASPVSRGVKARQASTKALKPVEGGRKGQDPQQQQQQQQAGRTMSEGKKKRNTGKEEGEEGDEERKRKRRAEKKRKQRKRRMSKSTGEEEEEGKGEEVRKHGGGESRPSRIEGKMEKEGEKKVAVVLELERRGEAPFDRNVRKVFGGMEASRGREEKEEKEEKEEEEEEDSENETETEPSSIPEKETDDEDEVQVKKSSSNSQVPRRPTTTASKHEGKGGGTESRRGRRGRSISRRAEEEEEEKANMSRSRSRARSLSRNVAMLGRKRDRDIEDDQAIQDEPMQFPALREMAVVSFRGPLGKGFERVCDEHFPTTLEELLSVVRKKLKIDETETIGLCYTSPMGMECDVDDDDDLWAFQAHAWRSGAMTLVVKYGSTSPSATDPGKKATTTAIRESKTLLYSSPIPARSVKIPVAAPAEAIPDPPPPPRSPTTESGEEMLPARRKPRMIKEKEDASQAGGGGAVNLLDGTKGGNQPTAEAQASPARKKPRTTKGKEAASSSSGGAGQAFVDLPAEVRDLTQSSGEPRTGMIPSAKELARPATDAGKGSSDGKSPQIVVATSQASQESTAVQAREPLPSSPALKRGSNKASTRSSPGKVDQASSAVAVETVLQEVVDPSRVEGSAASANKESAPAKASPVLASAAAPAASVSTPKRAENGPVGGKKVKSAAAAVPRGDTPTQSPAFTAVIGGQGTFMSAMSSIKALKRKGFTEKTGARTSSPYSKPGGLILPDHDTPSKRRKVEVEAKSSKKDEAPKIEEAASQSEVVAKGKKAGSQNEPAESEDAHAPPNGKADQAVKETSETGTRGEGADGTGPQVSSLAPGTEPVAVVASPDVPAVSPGKVVVVAPTIRSSPRRKAESPAKATAKSADGEAATGQARNGVVAISSDPAVQSGELTSGPGPAALAPAPPPKRSLRQRRDTKEAEPDPEPSGSEHPSANVEPSETVAAGSGESGAHGAPTNAESGEGGLVDVSQQSTQEEQEAVTRGEAARSQTQGGVDEVQQVAADDQTQVGGREKSPDWTRQAQSPQRIGTTYSSPRSQRTPRQAAAEVATVPDAATVEGSQATDQAETSKSDAPGGESSPVVSKREEEKLARQTRGEERKLEAARKKAEREEEAERKRLEKEKASIQELHDKADKLRQGLLRQRAAGLSPSKTDNAKVEQARKRAENAVAKAEARRSGRIAAARPSAAILPPASSSATSIPACEPLSTQKPILEPVGGNDGPITGNVQASPSEQQQQSPPPPKVTVDAPRPPTNGGEDVFRVEPNGPEPNPSQSEVDELRSSSSVEVRESDVREEKGEEGEATLLRGPVTRARSRSRSVSVSLDVNPPRTSQISSRTRSRTRSVSPGMAAAAAAEENSSIKKRQSKASRPSTRARPVVSPIASENEEEGEEIPLKPRSAMITASQGDGGGRVLRARTRAGPKGVELEEEKGGKEEGVEEEKEEEEEEEMATTAAKVGVLPGMRSPSIGSEAELATSPMLRAVSQSQGEEGLKEISLPASEAIANDDQVADDEAPSAASQLAERSTRLKKADLEGNDQGGSETVELPPPNQEQSKSDRTEGRGGRGSVQRVGSDSETSEDSDDGFDEIEDDRSISGEQSAGEEEEEEEEIVQDDGERLEEVDDEIQGEDEEMHDANEEQEGEEEEEGTKLEGRSGSNSASSSSDEEGGGSGRDSEEEEEEEEEDEEDAERENEKVIRTPNDTPSKKASAKVSILSRLGTAANLNPFAASSRSQPVASTAVRMSRASLGSVGKVGGSSPFAKLSELRPSNLRRSLSQPGSPMGVGVVVGPFGRRANSGTPDLENSDRSERGRSNSILSAAQGEEETEEESSSSSSSDEDDDDSDSESDKRRSKRPPPPPLSLPDSKRAGGGTSRMRKRKSSFFSSFA